jgi:uncharacterized membrane protein YgcG
MTESKEINEVQLIFKNTQAVPARNVEAEAHGRTLFLQQAASMKPAVSETAKLRLNEWLNNLFQKERVTMFVTILAILGLLLGGTGATVYASQDSFPDQMLYPVKMWSEQVRSDFSGEPQQRFELMLRFADERIDELDAMTKAGKTPPEGIVDRLRLHIDECLKLAVAQDDPEMLQTLEQLRDRLKLQEHKLTQIQDQAGPTSEALLTRARTMLQIRLQLVEEAQGNTQVFRNRVRTGIPTSLEEPVQQQETQREGFQQREELPAENTEENGKNFGPGTGENQWESNTPSPGSGDGPEAEKGGNPWTNTTPTPGSGYGSGDQTGCTTPDGCPKSGDSTGKESTGSDSKGSDSKSGSSSGGGSSGGSGKK